MFSIKEKLYTYLILTVAIIFIIISVLGYHLYYNLQWLQTTEEIILFLGLGISAITMTVQLGFRLIEGTIDRYNVSTSHILDQLRILFGETKNYMTRIRGYSNFIRAMTQHLHDIELHRMKLINHETFLYTKLYPPDTISQIPSIIAQVRQLTDIANDLLISWFRFYNVSRITSDKILSIEGDLLELMIKEMDTSQLERISSYSNPELVVSITLKVRKEKITQIEKLLQLRTRCIEGISTLEKEIENFLQSN